ncbi:MAG: type 1 glutamine amidotransferase [Pseudomonadota bacterium]
MAKVLVVEGNTPELALGAQKRMGSTAAQRYAAALREISPELEVDFAAPYFEDHDLDAIEMEEFDGMAVTGSGVMWSAADEQAAPFWRLYEKAFASKTPVFGSCWGMQNAAVVLGGETDAGPNGVEAGFARAVEPSDHPLHQGRRDRFDVICMHRDNVTRAPEGAVVTATNDHTAIQAFAYDNDGESFWGVQYHPESDLNDVSHWFAQSGGPMGGVDRRSESAILQKIASDPARYADMCVKLGVGLDILDRDYHLTEIRNWLEAKVL